MQYKTIEINNFPENFCQDIINKNPIHLYIYSKRIPDKNYDKNNINEIYIILQVYNLDNDYNYEIYDINECEWGNKECRWNIKKLLICLMNNGFYNFNGYAVENINQMIEELKNNSVNIEDNKYSLTLWDAECYIKSKSQSINAKEEDELNEILKEIENVKNKQISNQDFELVYKLKTYLIEMYGYKSENIKLEYKYNNFDYDLVVLKDNKHFIGFELKRDIKTIQNLYKKEEILNKHSKNFEYFVMVAPYENEWYMECYKNGELVNNIPVLKKYEEKIIENILKILYLEGKRNIKQVHSDFYKFMQKQNINITQTEKIILERLRSFVFPWNKKLTKIYYELIDRLNLQFDKYINIKILEFLTQLFEDKTINTNYPLKLLFEDFGINIDENSEQVVYFYDDDFDFSYDGVYFVPIEFLYMEKFKGYREKIKARIKLILEFEEDIVFNKNNYVLLFLKNKTDKCVIKKTSINNINLYYDYLFDNKHNHNIYEISKNALYINRLDSFYNKAEFYILEKLIKQQNAIQFLKIVNKKDISFGQGKVGFGEKKLIVKDSILNNEIIKEKIYTISNNDYKVLPKLKENNLLIVSMADKPLYTLISKEFENHVINKSIIGIYTNAKNIFKFFETIIGKIFLYRIINKYLALPRINIDNLFQLYILENMTYVYEDINEQFKHKTNKTLEEFYNEISGLDFKNITQIDESKKVLKGIYNQKFGGIKTFKTKLHIKNLKVFFDKLENTTFQRDIDEEHLMKLTNYIKEPSEFKYIPDIIFGVTNMENYNISFNNYEMFIDKDKYKQFLENLKIIDGQHRLKALENKDEIINIEFVFTSEDGMAVIFYILNAKVKPFIPKDFYKLFENKEQAFAELNKLESFMPYIFLEIKQYIEYLQKSIKYTDINYDIFICLSIYWSDIFENHDIFKKQFSKSYKKLIKVFAIIYKNLFLKYGENNILNSFENICSIFKIIIYLFYKENKSSLKYFIKEINGFLEWININSMFNVFSGKEDFVEFFKIYKKTYIPKSRKIYLSMPYHIHEDVIYFVAKDVVNEVSKKIGEKIELIRTDKRKLGIHKQIESKIYNEIEECDLMIADITGNNPNVYAEVGYKMAIDKSNGLKEPQIIFVKNSRGYYEKVYYNEKALEKYHQDEIIIDEKVRVNKVSNTAFNFAHIDQIEFDDVEYLQRELENMLLRYYNYYQIKKGV